MVAVLNDKINAQIQIDRANAVSAKHATDAETADPVLIELRRRKAAVLGLAAVYDQTPSFKTYLYLTCGRCTIDALRKREEADQSPTWCSL